MENGIINRLHKKAVAGKPMHGSEWLDLEQAVTTMLPDFYEKITNHQQLLSDDEFRVCVLTRLQFKPVEIANLLGLSQQRVTNIRSTINLKLFHQKGTKALESHLNAM